MPSFRFFSVRAGLAAAASVLLAAVLGAQPPLPGTQPLTRTGDLSAQMVAGLGRYFDRQLEESAAGRGQFWRPDFSSPAAHDRSVQPNRERLARLLGVVDPRSSHPQMELIAVFPGSAKVAETDRFVAYAVRWPAFAGVRGEGLLLEPKGPVTAQVVAIPDADQTPEALAGLVPGLAPERQYARRLAENGCRVVIPTLIDRADTFAGNDGLKLYTNEPDREWIYRQAFEMGRHVIGAEVEKIMAATDWLTAQAADHPAPIGLVGWGEGGLLAFYAAALDSRIGAVVVSGYFDRREHLWEEPIYRNLFGLLREFGDAEIAQLIVPRALIVEYSPMPVVPGPPTGGKNRLNRAAPGRITTAPYADVRAEFGRAGDLAGPFRGSLRFCPADSESPIGPLADATLRDFLQALRPGASALAPSGTAPVELRPGFDARERQGRQVRELEGYFQGLIASSREVRADSFWKKNPISTPEAWREAMIPEREKMWNELIGRLPASSVPPDPRSRQIYDEASWTGYEVTLEVAPDIFAWGYLLLPKAMQPGERRPVVVTQHGLEGVPADALDENPKSDGFRFYHAFARRLVEQGFIVFVPHNPYRGHDSFRVLQRKSNPLGESLFSAILAQHERILDWLAAQPWVDPKRIAFYGLSYGGKSAMRLPALLDRYCLSICAGDFNEWVYKVSVTDWSKSYLFAQDYEMPEFNLAMTTSYAEMAAMIAPRPFMVERGHWDGVSDDEWVSFEYAKVRRLYDELGIGDRTEIEYFNGPHTIHGVGTFAFLHRQLNWP